MQFLIYLEKIYSISFLAFLFYYIYNNKSNKENIVDTNSKKTTAIYKYSIVRALFSMILLIVLCVVGITKINFSLFFIIILIPAYFIFINSIYISAGILKDIIKSPQSFKSSANEKVAIYWIGLLF